MPDALDAIAVAADVVVAPHRLELGAEPAEFIDERLDLRRCSRARRVHPERAHHESRHAFPIVLGGADARIEKYEPQDIALLRRQRSIVGQHHGRRLVPGDDVPCGGPDKCWARLQRVEHALQPWRDAFVFPVTHLGGTAEAEQEEVLALDLRQHQGAGDAVEHIGRGGSPAPLFEPCVPCWTDTGALGDFLAAQSRCAAALWWKAERGRIELCAAVLQIGPKQVLSRDVLAHPISHYTTIISLLYHDKL